MLTENFDIQNSQLTDISVTELHYEKYVLKYGYPAG